MRLRLYLLLLLLPSLTEAQVVLQSSNLPIVIINSNGREVPDEPKIEATMGVVDNGPGKINQLTDPYNGFFGKIGIEIRGQSSQSFPKKAYAVEIRDASGNDTDAALLGLPAESDWSLYGPFNDKSLIRNALAYNLASRVMEYAPRTRFCELILNGNYRGVYLLVELIKRGKDRVDISKLGPDENSGDDLTGGYVLRHDKEPETTQYGWTSPYPPFPGATQKTWFFYLYPKPEDITTAQRNYIRDYISQFENTLLSEGFAHPVTGYRRFIDAGTFIDYMLVNELAKNVDGYRLSTYMYKDKDSDGGKLKMGPVWDFDLAFGNANYCDGSKTSGWIVDFNRVCPGDHWVIHFWWDRLRQDTAFMRQTRDRWRQLRKGPLANEVIFGTIDSMTNVLGPAVDRNFTRWPVLNEYVWPNNFIGGSYPAEINYLKEWIRLRLGWMDGALEALVTSSGDTLAQGTRLTVYPNPAASEFHFILQARKDGNGELRIFNTLGATLARIDAGLLSAGKEKKLTWAHHLPAGAYYVVFYQEGRRLDSSRIIVSY